jgi:hypothetical protein
MLAGRGMRTLGWTALFHQTLGLARRHNRMLAGRGMRTLGWTALFHQTFKSLSVALQKFTVGLELMCCAIILTF